MARRQPPRSRQRRPAVQPQEGKEASRVGQGPSADVSDSVMRQRLHAISHLGANAYLLALAAWQRGLKVTFHYTFAQQPRFAHLPFSGYRGEFLTVSDGRRHHAFYRVMGDRTTRESSAACEYKPHTRAVLAKAGVEVASGMVVAPGDIAPALAFLSKHDAGRYLLKPVDGTLGRGVLRDLSAAQVRDHLSTITEPMLLEAFVVGTENRVYVTGGRVISALIRRPASVEGDGRHSVRELVERKAAVRRIHPVYRDDPIVLDDAARVFLADHGHTPDDVPPLNTRVYLSDVPSQHAGGDMVDGTEMLPKQAAQVAVAATRALGLPNSGLDMIVSEGEAEDDHSARCVVLEMNQNPYIRLSSIPMPGIHDTANNRIAESIIDEYFPNSVTHHRFIRASFDFNAICQMLQSGTVAEVSLPVLGKDWAHERFILPATQVDQATIDRIHQARLRHGLHVQLLKSDTGDVIIDGTVPSGGGDLLRQAASLPSGPT